MAELKVSEIFHSIQGEGSRAGLPCVFVRLHGCGLRCSWCDTPYALDHREGGEMMETGTVLSRIAAHRCDFVELTGGEPLEQEAVFPFLTELCDQGFTVAVETGGHVDISPVDPRVILIMDVKCPGSGMEKKNRAENLPYLKPTDEVKFVVRDREDYEWMRAFIEREHLVGRCGEILVAPVFGEIVYRDLAAWILEDRLSVRLQLQLHKYIWDPDTRGV
ncbi:MAG: 4Fe-4S cluster-binding domain-containing protein [Bacteroidetes bacterium]|nr:4Fe-4S cluster-binding domain-containing protein [Bacteroidota bacterium]